MEKKKPYRNIFWKTFGLAVIEAILLNCVVELRLKAREIEKSIKHDNTLP